MADITLLIATRNRANSLKRCLLSLTGPSKGTLEVIVIDNASEDDTHSVLVELRDKVSFELINLKEEKIGKTYALLKGIKHSTGKILLFSDDDVSFSANWVDHCLDCFQITGCAGMGGPVIPVFHLKTPSRMNSGGPYQITAPFGWNLGDNMIDLTQAEHGKPYGANMGYLKEVILRNQVFEPGLGVFGKYRVSGEDVHVSERLMSLGHKIVYWPKAKVFHHVENPEQYSIRYLLKWHYAAGVGMSIRLRNLAQTNEKGIPRWLLREAIEHLALAGGASILGKTQKAVYHLCKFSVCLGRIKGVTRKQN
jgi:GT2 family glycosyltransferase